MSANFNKMFGLDERIFYAQFEPHKLNAGPHLLDKLIAFEREIRKMFRSLLDQAFNGHCEYDKTCIVISHPDLEEDILVTLRDLGSVSEDTILKYVEEEKLNTEKPFRFKFSIICTCDK